MLRIRLWKFRERKPMTKTTKMTISVFFLGIFSFVWTSSGTATAIENACAGQAAPEQAYSAYVDAVKMNDWTVAYSHVDPGSRAKLHKELVAGLIVSVGMTSDETQWRDLVTILQGHGFETNAQHQLLNANKDWHKIRDWPRLMSQISEFAERNFDQQLAPKHYELTDIRTTNDNAVGQLKLPNGKEKTVHFKKTDSGWCLAAR